VLAVAVPHSSDAQTIAITGGRVFPVSGAPIDNGTVLIRDGSIVAVGASVTIPADAQRIDASGKWVTPGFVNASTQLGVVEIGAIADTRDVNARGREGIAAAFTVWEGFNPASALIAPARNEGITSVVVAPGGGLIAGQAAMIDLLPGSIADVLVRGPVAMIAQIDNPGRASTGARGELLLRLREVLDDARLYARQRAAFERNETRDFAASRLDLEALQPVLRGTLPLVITADRASDIEAALKLAADYGLRIMIVGGAEAWLVADKLAAAKVPVLTGAMQNIPGSFTTLGIRQENAGLLRRAGVDVALVGNGPGDPETFNVRNIRQEAGNAVAYGMTWDDALRAVTLVPAQIFGLGERMGSLQAGRTANVVIWSGDPFELSTVAEQVFIRGRKMEGDSRQDMLVRRYRQLPPDYRAP
jgi:imidazolonepropionase-like amidohydrolase